jgi:hypothetical protein
MTRQLLKDVKGSAKLLLKGKSKLQMQEKVVLTRRSSFVAQSFVLWAMSIQAKL